MEYPLKILLLILLLSLILLVYNIVFIHSTSRSPLPFQNVWDKENRQLAVSLLKKTNDILLKHNMSYILAYGTLLGAMRHGGFIPWDDDIDLAVMNLNPEKIKSDLEEEGIGIVNRGSGMDFHKVFFKNRPKILGTKWSHPFIDLFALYSNGTIGDSFGFVHNNKSDIFPIGSIIFEGITVSVPNNPEKVLDKMYGNDWSRVCISSGYNHRTESLINDTPYSAPCKQFGNVGKDIYNYIFPIKRVPEILKHLVRDNIPYAIISPCVGKGNVSYNLEKINNAQGFDLIFMGDGSTIITLECAKKLIKFSEKHGKINLEKLCSDNTILCYKEKDGEIEVI